jgi:P-type E1-E2 ATPase
MIDPPKEGVRDAIETCRTAGIKVFMVTGDHPKTAENIARQVAIIKDYKTKNEIAKEKNIKVE